MKMAGTDLTGQSDLLFCNFQEVFLEWFKGEPTEVVNVFFLDNYSVMFRVSFIAV